jgi:cytochrome P450
MPEGIAHPPSDLAERLLEPGLYVDDPFPLYDELRSSAPVAWCASRGFWALTRHRDVSEVSVDPGRFRSGAGILVDEIGHSYDSPPTMMHTDPPAHTRYRRLVQPSFKPTAVRPLDEPIRSMAASLLDGLPVGEAVDIVPSLSVPFPLQVICELLGTDPGMWPTFFEWSEAAIPGNREMTAEERGAVQLEMWEHLIGLATERRSSPADDVVSQLACAQIDGEELSEAELAMFLIQLLVAGNETTRNLISGGLVALAEHPAQLRALIDDPRLIPRAVEELLRWTSPVVSFLRTATRDTELSGVAIAEGDPVLMVYAAANRDPEAFGASAGSFDVSRDPNPHLGLGFGTHFCLGAPLARLEAAIVLEEILKRFSGFELAGEVVRSPSSIIAGVTSAPLVFRPKGG